MKITIEIDGSWWSRAGESIKRMACASMPWIIGLGVLVLLGYFAYAIDAAKQRRTKERAMEAVRAVNAGKPANSIQTRKQPWEYSEVEKRVGERMMLGLPPESPPQEVAETSDKGDLRP